MLSPLIPTISTHTLRGERDDVDNIFGLDRVISTHTLRGERDGATKDPQIDTINFNSHAPWGA